MKGLFLSMLVLAACGNHLTERDRRRLATTIGVAATDVATAADPGRLQVIATELQATDAATHKLGETECALLQARTLAFGQEVAAIMPLLVRDPTEMERVSSELQGAVPCLPGQPLEVGKVGRILRESTAAVQKALVDLEHHGG